METFDGLHPFIRPYS